MSEKEDWVDVIQDSCEVVRQFFDGISTSGFTTVQPKTDENGVVQTEGKEGWLKLNGKKVYCTIRDGLLVWYNEEPSTVLLFSLFSSIFLILLFYRVPSMQKKYKETLI